MFDPFNLAMLAAESQQVVSLRLWKLAWGASAGAVEAFGMVAEKMHAGSEAAGRLMSGANLRQRRHIRLAAMLVVVAVPNRWRPKRQPPVARGCGLMSVVVFYDMPPAALRRAR